MAWIESHQTLRRHPKTLHLVTVLGIPLAQAVGHLHCLWWWALDYADDGDLTRFPAEVLGQAAEWPGDGIEFLNALVTTGFMNTDKTIHDWMDYAGRLVERRKSDARRKYVQRTSDGHPMERGSTVTQPLPNQPLPTEPTRNGVKPEELGTWPDWYGTLYQIKGFTFSLKHCQEWLANASITEVRANEVAYAVKSKWPGPKSKPYTDPWATFQSWVKRPPLQGGRSMNQASQSDIGAYDFAGAAEARARRREHERELKEADMGGQ